VKHVFKESGLPLSTVATSESLRHIYGLICVGKNLQPADIAVIKELQRRYCCVSEAFAQLFHQYTKILAAHGLELCKGTLKACKPVLPCCCRWQGQAP
jgi:hypothetical protein